MTRSEQGRSWWIPAVVSAVAFAILGIHAGALPIAYAVVAVSSIPIVLTSLRRGWIHRRAGVVLVAVIGISTTAMWLRSRTRPDHPAVGESFALVAGVILLVCVGWIVRNRRGHDFWDVLADGGIVAV